MARESLAGLLATAQKRLNGLVQQAASQEQSNYSEEFDDLLEQAIAEVSASLADLQALAAGLPQSNQTLIDSRQHGQINPPPLGKSEDRPKLTPSEVALQFSEKQRQLALDLAGTASWNWDISTGGVLWSANMFQLLGLTPGEVEPSYSTWRNYVHPEDIEKLEVAIASHLQNQTTYEQEYRIIHPDGTIHWLLSKGQGIYDVSGQAVQMVGITIDISDRKHLELSLQASEAKLSDILNSAIASIVSFRIFTNGNWQYEYWSKGCEKLFGYTIQELMADPNLWLSRVVAEDRETILLPLFDDFFAERNTTAKYRFCHKDGSIRWILSTYTSRKRQPGDWIITVVNTDITERQQAQIALQRQLEREKLVAEITQYIRQSLDLSTVLHRTVERVRQFLNTDRVIIFRFRHDWQGIVVMESVGENWISILRTTISDPCFGDLYGGSYRQGRVSAIDNLYTARLKPCYVKLLEHFQVQANLVVPILQADNLWGLLIAHHCSAPRQWQPEEIDLLQQLASQVGIAIQQSELYQQTQRELVEHQQMQNALQESEERFRSLSTSAPIGICQTNADGICLYTNTHWQEMLGLSFEDCLGNCWTQAIHPDDRQRISALWEAYLQGNQEFTGEFRFQNLHGESRWVSVHAAPMLSAAGEIMGHVGTAEDITERKRAEDALRDSEQRLQAILDNSPAIIYMIDPQHKILLANRRYVERLNTTVENVLGKSLYDVWPAETADAFVANNRKVLETNHLMQIEEMAPQPDGLHTYIAVKFPLQDEAGIPYAVCGISTDITEKKQLEEQFYRAQRMESLGTLASGIAHDLNNVFTPILAIAQLLLSKPRNLDARSQEMLQLLVDSTKRGANLVKQVLTFTRGSEGDRIPLQLGHVLLEVIKIIQQTFPKFIEIRHDIPIQKLWLISADSTQIHQVFMNICINTRDAMPEGGTLTLTAENRFVDATYAQMNLEAQKGNYVVVTIADTGTGIPSNLLDRIFDPFFTTKEPGKGTGLGLSTVLGIVKNHAGFIQVYSEVGRGTQFRVYLPAITETPTVAIAQEEIPYGDGELVLIVDDEAIVQQATRATLENYHYKTLIASDGIEALALYAEHRQETSVVLIDMMMPNMDGFTTIRTLQRMNPQVKIIAASGLPSNRQQALAMGAQIFLSKPYTTEDLLNALHNLASRAAEQSSN